MKISFRFKLLLTFISLLMVTSGITIYAVLQATERNLKDNTGRELQVAERVLQKLLDENSRQLTDRAQLLAEDFGFKQAIATRESNTINSVLANHGQRINADMIVLLDTDANIIVSTHAIDSVMSHLTMQIRASDNSFSLLVLAESQPYQLVMVPINAPDRIAWVGLGFSLDAGLLRSFKQITGMDISLIYTDQQSGMVNYVSTLPEPLHPIVTSGMDITVSIQQFLENLQMLDWLNESWVLLDNGDHITAVLSVDLQRMLAANQSLRWQMIIVAIVALLLAVFATVILAKRITRPIAVLVKVAKRIAGGDYHTRLSLKADNEFGLLGRALDNMLGAIREREERISYQAKHDLLTGLPNRYSIATYIKKVLLSKNAAPQFGFVILKIANLQSLMDVYGDEVCYKLLRLIADKIANTLNENDKLGRFTEDQFLLIIEALQKPNSKKIVNTMLIDIGGRFYVDGIEVGVDLRAGITLCPEHGSNYDDLLRRANIALRYSLSHHEVFSLYETGHDEIHLRQIKVSNRLQYTIKNDGFELHYQPQYDLQNQCVYKVEALLRWTDTELGRMFPDEFIPLAERTGEITLITEWVLQQVVNQLLDWKQRDIPLKVSMNLSPKDILSRSLIKSVIDLNSMVQLEPDRLSFELTESAMVSDPQHAVSNMNILRDAGFTLAIDDFGTGFSSLAQLKLMPVKELKIDKSFILKLDHHQDDQQIVRSTIDMAHHLGLRVVAEGVENQSSMDLLENMGCDIIQGYHLARPMPADELEQWLQRLSEQRLVALQTQNVNS